MLWVVTGFLAVAIYMERDLLISSLRRYLRNNQVQKPIIDEETGLKEIVDWIVSADDFGVRVDRVKEISVAIPQFKSFLDMIYDLGNEVSFEKAVASGVFVVRSENLDKYACVPFAQVIKELPDYSDNGPCPFPDKNRIKILSLLDVMRPEDSSMVELMIKGINSLPRKLNHKVYETAFDLGKPEGQLK